MTETSKREGSDIKSGVSPAFPTSNPYEGNGMSLRDWFAGQALNACLDYHGPKEPSEAAVSAYAIADAMVKERSK
jgi:hypothetical protein